MLFVILITNLLSPNLALASTSAPMMAEQITRQMPKVITKSATIENPIKKNINVPFYKSIASLFPSGSLNLEILKKQQVFSKESLEPSVQSNESNHSTHSDQYYKWNKIYFSADEIKPIFATHLSRYVIDSKGQSRFKVVDANTNSLQLFDVTKKYFLKKDIHDVKADAYDLGYVMVLKDSYLRSQAQHQTRIQTTIPKGTRLVVEKYQQDFALVQYQNYKGYIHLSELITKFDFATFVYANNKWHQVQNRQFDKIISVQNTSIPLNFIQGIITSDTRGIIASTSQKIPIWSQVEIVHDQVITWNQSYLKGHGLVWWKPIKETEQIYYSIDELLTQEIASVSFHPQNPLKGILSSNGVYITEDGHYWKKLPQFEKFNGPVHYFNDLLLFVGNFRSTNGGQTFDNYIQIDKLTSAIEFQFGFFPKTLQVKKIETTAPFKLKIEIETGIRKIQMESPLFTQDWKAVKS